MPETIVHVIEATKKSGNTTAIVGQAIKRVAAYARVSTAEEEQLSSYQNQVDYYTRYIQSRPGWEFVGMYSDEGISGLNTKNRDGFNQMVADALAGKIDLILTKSISRFARNTVDSLTTIRKLKEVGVEVYFEKENIYTMDSKGELLLSIMSSLAQEESRSISENVTWGRWKNMARGKVSMSYGNFLGYEKGPDGKPQIVEEEAEIVRRIYDMFLDGSSVREIARVFTDEGIPTPSGRGMKWAVSTVLSILRNEKYKGDALLQKTFTVDFLTKKVQVNHGEERQYYVENSHPAIIDRETFDLVQEELANREGGKRGPCTSTPFDGKIVCADCGKHYTRILWYSHNSTKIYIWRCAHKYDREQDCQTPIVYEQDLQIAFLAALNQVLGAKETYISELEQEIERVVSQQNKGDGARGPKTEQERSIEAAANARLGRIKRYLATLGQQPMLVTEFRDDMFTALVENITVQINGDLTVHFKDGTAVPVPKNDQKDTKQRKTAH